jgi:hypothetical protein
MVSVMYGTGVQDLGSNLDSNLVEKDLTPIRSALRAGARNILVVIISEILNTCTCCYRIMICR